MWLDDYEYQKRNKLGSGGNATVYAAKKRHSEEEVALKVLHHKGKYFEKKLKRFKAEVKVVKKYQDDLTGIIPIIDFNLDGIHGFYWYTMPIATTLNEKTLSLESTEIDQKINICIELAKHLSNFHKNSIYHRDIKPSNIYYYEGTYCFGDFGLVDYPEKEELTSSRESVGPKATIAPEMKWDAQNADGSKADVYSLAKTLWMLLTSNEYAFEGTYDSSSPLMGLKSFFPEEHLVELENLLYLSTKDSPTERPTIAEFIASLSLYLEVKNDYTKYNLSQWKSVQKKLFPTVIPERASWTNIDSIVSVLNLISEMPSLNHMFYPSSGGSDLEFVEKAGEEGFIYLHTGGGSIDVLRPKQLYLENFGDPSVWSYLRLDLEEVSPIFENLSDSFYELLTEDRPGNYLSWEVGNYRHYEDGSPVPKSTKLVSRYHKGSFVFFSKKSIYNSIGGTYNGNHALVSNNTFRKYIIFLMEGIYTSFKLKELINLQELNLIDKIAEFPFLNIGEIENNLDITEAIHQIIENYLFNKDQYKLENNPLQKHNSSFEKSITEIDFSDVISQYKESAEESVLEYCITWGKLFNFNEAKLYLKQNGKFSFGKNNLFIINSRIDLNKLYFLCEIKLPNQDNKSLVKDALEVELKRNKKPTHLFTKNEIKSVLLAGDDHQPNTLVINEFGVASLINPTEEKGRFYPVRLETFAPYNNYVGKYSSLNHLDDTYLNCLSAWLDHLKYGKFIYSDHHELIDEKETLLEINQFY
ncbi:MAG: protein kinase [Desemzia incerta]|uniref:protein kinase domain-containing protein n=1 Tax=Desemzia incerta TaxID=82801 RepID=UPI003314C52C